MTLTDIFELNQLCTDVAELERRLKKESELSLELSCLCTFPQQRLSLFGLFSASSGHTC